MAFGKKKATETTGPIVTQANVALLATEALAKRRQERLRLALTATLKSPMLMHRWSQKSLIEMLTKMAGGAPLPKEAKDLMENYEASKYKNEEGALVVPCRMIKACLIEGAISTDKVVTKADIKRNVRVVGHTSPVNTHGKDVNMDVRPTRLPSGQVDIASRALVPMGSTFSFVLEFPANFGPDRVMAALDAAGATIGIGDWRPDKGGEFGTFSVGDIVSDVRTIARIMKECETPEITYEIPPHLLHAMQKNYLANGSDVAKKAAALVNHVNGQNRKRGASVGGEA